MKNLILAGLFFSLFCLNGCSGKSAAIVNATNSGNSAKPLTGVNTAAVQIPEKNAQADEFKDVQIPQCKIYLTTIKKLSTCTGLPEDQRKKYVESYPKLLAHLKVSYSDSQKSARDMTIFVCESGNKALQPVLEKCK